MSSPGLELRSELPIDADVVLQEPATSVSTLHRQLFDLEQDLPQQLFAAVRDLVAGQPPGEARETLREHGVTALDGLYGTLAVQAMATQGTATGTATARPQATAESPAEITGLPSTDPLWEFLGVTRELGTGADRFDLRSSIDDIYEGTVPIFEAADVTPTIGVVLDDAFTQARRDQRNAILDLLLALSRGCHVALVVGPIERRFLYTKHRAQLPGSVEDDCRRHLETHAADSVQERVAAAFETFDMDSPAMRILTALTATPSELLTYSELSSRLHRARSTIRYHVTQRLTEHDLVARCQHNGDAAVTLTLVGKRLTETSEFKTATRRGDSTSVEGISRSSEDIREAPREHASPSSQGAGSSGPKCSGAAQIQPYSFAQATAVIAGAEDADIGIVDHPVEDIADQGGDFREGRWFYDADRNELTIGAQWVSPLQYALCLAFALTNHRTWDQVLTPEVLDAEIFEQDVLSDPWFLRGTRQLGYLKDAQASGSAYIDAIETARDDLYELTNRLEYGNYDDDQRALRREILQEAHGLIGTVTHLLDLADVTLTRELRIPNFARDFSQDERKDDILRFLCKAIPIASTYGQFSAEKILLENRDAKRKWALCAPDVDYRDPTGRHIGSWTIVGDFGSTIDSFQDDLEDELSNPSPLQKDADTYADFEVPLTVRRVDDRSAYEVAVTRLLERKHIDSVPEAVNWLQALTGSVYDVTAALRWLGKEDYRAVESRDLKYALASLPASRLLPDAKPTVGKIVTTLLADDRDQKTGLTKREIAARAEISESAVYDREHWTILEELGIVTETDSGWIITLTLPFDRDDSTMPWWHQDTTTTLRDVLWRLHTIQVADTDPMTERAITFPPDFEQLLECWPSIDPWIDVILALLNQGFNDAPSKRTITFGDEPNQQSLSGSIEPAVAD